MWLYLLLLALFLLPQHTFAADKPIDIIVVDRSGAGSPLEITGTVSLQETIAGNEVSSAWVKRILARNVSEKSILLLVADFSASAYHSRSAAERIFADFFNAPLHPGELVPGMAASPARMVACCINPLDKGSEPKAEFRVLFVQFEDGSTFGDSTEAEKPLTYRAANLRVLRDLAQVYNSQGAQEFQAQLQQQQSSLFLVANIQDTFKQKGTTAAIAQLRKFIALAEMLGTTISLDLK